MTTAETTGTMSTPGQQLTAELRRRFHVGPRTRCYRNRLDLHRDMIEAIYNATAYPGYYGEDATRILGAAWGTYLAYTKHVNGYRIDGTLRLWITSLSPYRFAALLGRMVDAGVTNTGAGETFFADLAREVRKQNTAAARSPQ